jgi:glycosyltransferase involved in cell wall biosynthesis
VSKSVSICITNYQSGDTVALAIESIRKFMDYPHEIAVYDDASDTRCYDDIKYLRECRDKGWIRLVEGDKRVNHGPALARLLATCDTDLAMILDCDIQIIGSGWLEPIVKVQEKTGAAMVVDLESFPDNPSVLKSWFFMLDLKQYPFVKAGWDYSIRPDFVSWSTTPNALYPTGYLVWKNCHDQHRPVVPLPAGTHEKFRHHTHMSVLSYPMEGENYEIRQKRYLIIQDELRKLRSGK